MKKFSSLLLIAMLFAYTQVLAQISDNEMNQFASAVQKVEGVNQQVQQAMVKAVEKEGLNVERFNEIYQAEQDPTKESNSSQEELQKFKSANAELGKLQSQAQVEMEKQVKSEGLTTKRYQEIATTIQKDRELQQKLQKILQGEK